MGWIYVGRVCSRARLESVNYRTWDVGKWNLWSSVVVTRSWELGAGGTDGIAMPPGI